MKKLITDVADGLESLLGERVMLWCANYIYSGVVEGVSATCVKLTDAHVVYETGELTSSENKNTQQVGSDLYVQIAAVESFYVRQ